MERLYFSVDVGGSSTKTFSIFEGKENFKIHNNYVLKHDGYVDTKDFIIDDNDYATKLDLGITINSNPKGDFRLNCKKIIDEINGNRWLMGDLSKAVSPNATKLPLGIKVRHTHYYLNIISALVQEMEEKGLTDVNVFLGVLIPARQYFDLDKEMINEIFSGEINVKNNITGSIYRINIEEIIIKPEAVVAFNSCFIKDGKLTELGKDLADKFNVVIDIGENTIDIAGIRGGKPDPSTFDSFSYAGALLMQYLSKEIYRKFNGYNPTINELWKAFSTGYLTLGAYDEWIGEEITNANRELAFKLFNDFTQSYLLGKGIHMPQIASFMFVGGGSTKLDKVTSVGEHFMVFVKEQSRYTRYVMPDDIRLANIQGIADIMRLLYVKGTK